MLQKIKTKRHHWGTLILILLLVIMTACSGSSSTPSTPSTDNTKTEEAPATTPASSRTIIFGDAGWDSVRFHTSVAQKIIEHGYGYRTDTITGSSTDVLTGLSSGDIDALMELWSKNNDDYQAALSAGEVFEVSHNFDGQEGLYVPTYLIAGADALAPTLTSLLDLPQYWELFKDPNDSSKGILTSALDSWSAHGKIAASFEEYQLNQSFNYRNPPSDSALANEISQALEAKQPWVGYYWEPTALMGKYDMTLLQEPADQNKFPPSEVLVAAHLNLKESAPEVFDFLSNYVTGSQLTSTALFYMEDNGLSADDTAIWFLQNYEDVWTKWVPNDVAEKIKAAIQ
ncbi:glycine betaine ABC transporter substrate-binding protein [Caldalkalibacillus mannanilyticus]|uniref:glycine betaine ABC transporter substrate-binding protein n=1 Tax=Caldalkalibacillus mannanilyticus TaxID=1418 RepID=UPI00046AE556|nr:glycine betaine ABC transporter substrate-binding protein [Caldalkalibacillus mannanilyticus]